MNTHSGIEQNPVLLGSTFPLSLIRRRVVIEPISVRKVQEELEERGFVSFWGHHNTAAAASSILGVEVTPDSERPAVMLNEVRLPVLKDRVFHDCLVLSPQYVIGFRPPIGKEVPPEKITGWQALRVVWE